MTLRPPSDMLAKQNMIGIKREKKKNSKEKEMKKQTKEKRKTLKASPKRLKNLPSLI